MKKADLVEKIAKEQNLDPKKLSRLSVDQLKKMDEVVPDAEEVEDAAELGDILGEEEADQESVSVGVEEEAVDDVEADVVAESPKERRLVGHHPITKEPVYK